VVAFDAETDFAVLRLDVPIPFGLPLDLIRNRPVPTEGRWQSYFLPVGEEHGAFVNGHVRNKTVEGRPSLRLELPQPIPAHTIPSISGAPAVAFQEPRLFPWRDVLTNVQYGLTRTTLSREAARARSELALAEIGLTDHAQSWPLTLSGGQAQRVSLARALVADPELLLLDEPFGALDALTRLSMRELLLDLWREHGFGVLLVTHDVDEAVALADRVLVLDEGRVVHTMVIDDARRAPSDPSANTERYRAELLHELGVQN